jgi:O-Antigen ligase
LLTRSEKVIWLFFAATSLQLAFLQPYITLAPGVRTNLFSGLLCFLTLAVALIFARQGAIRWKSPEFLVSAALVVLGVISALHSSLPLASSFRVFVLLASGLGGFWCARILLNTPKNQECFLWLCTFLLAAVVLLSLAGYLTSREIGHYFFKGANHPLVNLIFLWSFAPLTLLGRKSRRLTLVGAILLVLSYVVLCLSQRLSVVFIPLGLGILGLVFGALRWKQVVVALLVIGTIIGFAAHRILWFKANPANEVYRIENYFFSWSIAAQHPLLGIGLRVPREGFLKDYRLKFAHEPKEKFAMDVADIVTSDNQILTFLVGIGFPFTIIYGLAVLILLVKLIRVAGQPPPGLYLPPLAILFSLGLAVVHWQLYDGLLFPQDSWFFHVLLGLIPVTAVSSEAVKAEVDADLSYFEMRPNPDIIPRRGEMD